MSYTSQSISGAHDHARRIVTGGDRSLQCMPIRDWIEFGPWGAGGGPLDAPELLPRGSVDCITWHSGDGRPVVAPGELRRPMAAALAVRAAQALGYDGVRTAGGVVAWEDWPLADDDRLTLDEGRPALMGPWRLPHTWECEAYAAKHGSAAGLMSRDAWPLVRAEDD